MSIEDRLEDVELLLQHQRYDGALTILIIAIAASARKVYPRTMKSFDQPEKAMGDGESFRYFLGSRIKSIIQNNSSGPYPRRSSLLLEFRGRLLNVEDIIYKYCRNSLLHEGVMDPDIELVATFETPPQATFLNNGIEISLSCGEKLTLSLGWLDLFKKVVCEARCNNPHLPNVQKKLTANPDFNDPEFIEDISNKYMITPNRIREIKRAAYFIDPKNIKKASDDELRLHFKKALAASVINAEWQHRLASKNIINELGELQPIGFELMRIIGDNYTIATVPIEEL